MSTDDADLRGRAAELVSLVSVQDGAVVSRTIVDAPGGTVTLFAFDDGQALSEHTAPFDALVVLLAGRMEITLAGQGRELRAGEALLMPADVPHALHAAARSKMLLIMVRS